MNYIELNYNKKKKSKSKITEVLIKIRSIAEKLFTDTIIFHTYHSKTNIFIITLKN